MQQMNEQEHKQLEDLHRFFMEPRAPGKKSRAEEIDDALAGLRTGKMSVRAFLWVCGAVVALIAAYQSVKGFKF